MMNVVYVYELTFCDEDAVFRDCSPSGTKEVYLLSLKDYFPFIHGPSATFLNTVHLRLQIPRYPRCQFDTGKAHDANIQLR